MSQTTVAITGANRGIGRGLVTTYLSRPQHTVLAFVRDPQHETSQSLFSEATGAGSKVVLVPYDASDLAAADKTVSYIDTNHPEILSSGIDAVIANAGISQYFGPSLDASPELYRDHFTTNTLGPLMLFKAIFSLLKLAASKKSESKSRFIAISSAGGSTAFVSSQQVAFDTEGKPRAGALPYGASKCALNHIMARLSLEYSGQGVAFGLFTPGPTKTGLGGGKVDFSKIPNLQPIEKVVPGLVRQFDELGGESEEEGKKAVVLKDWSGKEYTW